MDVLGEPAGTVRAVSLDLWMTLLRSHPEFKARRAAMLRAGLGLDVDDAVFAATLRSADRRADDFAETTGRDHALADRLRLTLDGLVAAGALDAAGASAAAGALADPATVRSLLAQQHELALELPPRPLHPDLPALLARLARHVPLAVTSNTGMIPGTTMRALLAANDLLAPFSVLTFSDEVGAPKPDRRLFDATVRGLATVLPEGATPLRHEHVVHVGDNPRADVAGAGAAGLVGLLVDDVAPVETALADVLRAARVTRVAVHTLSSDDDPADDDPADDDPGRPARAAGGSAAAAGAAGPTGFDARTYSWAKHGDLDAVDVLGAELAAELARRVPALVEDPAPPVLPVAYLAVPPACLLLARRVLADLDAVRVARGLPPGRVVRVEKDSVTHTDYATASQQARRAELAGIGFRLTEDVSDGQVVVVDDIRVTGLAEVAVLRALDAAGVAPERCVVAYVAVADRGLAADPGVEARLNHAAVTSVADLAPVVGRGRFALTIRFLKRLLGAPGPERAAFLAACPPPLLDQVLDGARATGDAFCATYAAGLADVAAERAVRAGAA
ncbi:phosphoribosyltransferase family protein [Luteimicrobium subarcticum]|uniref:FMN phosphatase YigB (HAD superfamily) n=1 Tax=Luteimicrobium subarcticum TaxID=620910 RepID=A0A2M8WW10_9MICO|nr:phosphoribosyltransferase family protein [Luteimicrobium subarcticum]PJI95103.1 FMN phosphatase YigB (HAD superfamily) [Luteimicrobium subarcticum]